MKQIRPARLGALIALLAVSLFGSIHALAQSTIDLTVHYVEGFPAEGEIAYDVNVYLSVFDGSGNPVRDLTTDSITAAEDSQKVELRNLRPADEPIAVILVMDTSGSMSGPKIADARSAASNFIGEMKENDRAAIMTFDENVKLQMDFTANHTDIRDRLARIDASPGSGTCLHDAAYQAVQLASTLPSGRRAVILFTDGVDETASGGRACSVHTLQDVVELASQGGTRTPIYALGLGNRIDEKSLQRVAELTGGRYIYAPDSSQLEEVFQTLSNQLRSQYVLSYKSFAAPGAHTLAVSVNHLGAQDSDTRNFLLPALPARVTILAPADGGTVGGSVKAVASISGQGTAIDRVEFEINGEVVGSDDATPYELEIDLLPYEPGALTLSAVAYDETNAELARASINVIRAAPTAVPTTVVIQPTPTPAPQTDNTILIVGAVLGGLGLITILLLALMLARQRRQEKGGAAAETVVQTPRTPYREKDADRTMDSWEGGPEAFGILTVEASDDPSMIGHRFEISASLTTLGRSADNDINFPKDNPVSRRHAEIFERNRRLFIREVEAMDSSGEYRPPKYGTFVNEVPLGAEPAGLKSGDEIRLGKRVRLRFEAYERAGESEALTFDDMTLGDDPDKTVDQS
ncbi:MAG: VWA domain-containing protein [Anaerolineales bacterium]|nr:VWA domain-containing protein [Anaerolineales bacterium]NUQ83450.1 VWA domain-containing protein [Anaerolineales bacterium]